jgi:exodeoxyribonuclease X
MLVRVIDLETTGFEPPQAGVCEIGWCDLLQRPEGWEVGAGSFVLVDPGHPITPATSAVHHIVDEDVRGAPPFSEAIRDVLFDGLRMEAERTILAAHSAKFERLFVTEEHAGSVEWICTYKCALRLWPEAPLHSNQGLRYWRRPAGLDRSLASAAHRAFPDAYVTAHHLRDLLALAPMEDLIRWSSEPALQVRCHIGKNRGLLWSEVEFSFLQWISDRDFDEDVLFTVQHEMQRRRDIWKAEAEAERHREASEL